jgi:hypothetical protein
MPVEQAPDVLKDQVHSFTSRHLGVKENKLSTTTRLNRDLGMDGEDAVEFFKDFAAKFDVNLDGLYADWDKYFGPEGGPSFGFLVIVVLSVIAGSWLRLRFGLFPDWVWGIALIIAAILSYNFGFAHKMLPITVGDLIESARLGRWNKS